MNLPTGGSGLRRQRSGLACQGAGGCGFSTLSLQCQAEETPLAGKYLALRIRSQRTWLCREAGGRGGGGRRSWDGAGGGCGPSGVLTAPSQGFCSWASGAMGKSCIQKVVFQKCHPTRPSFWKGPSRLTKMTFLIAPLWISKYGVFLGKWTFLTQLLVWDHL